MKFILWSAGVFGPIYSFIEGDDPTQALENEGCHDEGIEPHPTEPHVWTNGDDTIIALPEGLAFLGREVAENIRQCCEEDNMELQLVER